ncbi:MAG: hypothetical protein NZL93_04550, partial [Chthoniobacterales bacterium]|nr:hypothetical protein [Chthoniobacterales bacterium]
MSILSPLAGKLPPPEILTNIPRLLTNYFLLQPDPQNPLQRVAFGTSGHRGSSFDSTFNEDHILAISQAIAEYRNTNNIKGPLYLGMDTHALSEAAHATAIEVLAANGIRLCIDASDGYAPTPAISLAILVHNSSNPAEKADGIVITPSHNPPSDGGFKYNPPNGGPADTSVTSAIEKRANEILNNNLRDVKRIPLTKALSLPTTEKFDYRELYIREIASAIDFAPIRSAGIRIGVDPLGNSCIPYWPAIADRYGISIEVVNSSLDPTFRFLHVDWDGKIRMDCSSPHAMAGLINLKDRYDIAFANDTDADRHGIVAPSSGLLNPNHYLAVAIHYLFTNRPNWPANAAIGKTAVSSSLIDRVAASLGRKLVEVPVGFKWFVEGLFTGSLGFGGEESAGASFLRSNGTVWTTDKDGLLLGLLAAEITARTNRDPGQIYQELTRQFGEPIYERTDAPATPEHKSKFKSLTPDKIQAKT